MGQISVDLVQRLVMLNSDRKASSTVVRSHRNVQMTCINTPFLCTVKQISESAANCEMYWSNTITWNRNRKKCAAFVCVRE